MRALQGFAGSSVREPNEESPKGSTWKIWAPLSAGCVLHACRETRPALSPTQWQGSKRGPKGLGVQEVQEGCSLPPLLPAPGSGSPLRLGRRSPPPCPTSATLSAPPREASGGGAMRPLSWRSLALGTGRWEGAPPGGTSEHDKECAEGCGGRGTMTAGTNPVLPPLPLGRALSSRDRPLLQAVRHHQGQRLYQQHQGESQALFWTQHPRAAPASRGAAAQQGQSGPRREGGNELLLGGACPLPLQGCRADPSPDRGLWTPPFWIGGPEWGSCPGGGQAGAPDCCGLCGGGVSEEQRCQAGERHGCCWMLSQWG